jgi:hypothetical protein
VLAASDVQELVNFQYLGEYIDFICDRKHKRSEGKLIENVKNVLFTTFPSFFWTSISTQDLRFDNFTKFVCQQCAENVVAAYKCKIQCLASDAYLRGVIDNDSEEGSEAETQDDQNESRQIKLEPIPDSILIIEPEQGEDDLEDNVLESEIEDDNEEEAESSIKEERMLDVDEEYIIDEKDISGYQEDAVDMDSSEPEESAAEEDEFDDIDWGEPETTTLRKAGRKPSMNSLYLRSCCQCLDTFATEAELIEHFNAIHTQCIKQNVELLAGNVSQAQSKNQCILCHKMVRQIHTHRRRKRFKDYQDDSTVLGRKQNKLYLRSCCACPKMFDDEKEVIDHFASAHAERVKHNFKLQSPSGNQKQCALCYKLVRNIHTHRRRMHSKDFQARVDPDGDWKFKCDICDVKFSTRNKLNKHNKYNHTGEANVPPQFQDVTVCPICGLETNSPCLLDKHLLKEHPESKCIECKVCKKMLKLATSLRKHLLTHNAEVLFDCDLCEDVFLNMGGKCTFKSPCIN